MRWSIVIFINALIKMQLSSKGNTASGYPSIFPRHRKEHSVKVAVTVTVKLAVMVKVAVIVTASVKVAVTV
jgi:hypothetical protein